MESKMRRREGGVALVEASLAMALTLFVYVAGVHLILAGYKAITMKYTLSKALRWAAIGETLPNPSNPSLQLSREGSIELRVLQIAQPYSLFTQPFVPGSDYKAIQICSSSLTQNFNCTTDKSGSANDMLRLTASIPLNIFNFKINVTSTVVGRLEPYA